MTIRYSYSTGNFYPHYIEYPHLPDDLIKVDEDDYAAAMSRPAGHTFQFENGQLVITAPTPTPVLVLCDTFLVGVRKTRDGILNRLAGIGFAAVASGDADTVQAIIQARTYMLDITICPTVTAARDLDELQAAVSSEFQRIADTLPQEARRAFEDAGITLAPSTTPPGTL
ncbi:hypothetical protein SKZ59_24440 [Janthinobacterium sp. GMG2]|uniref:hypothetical protein n=1 Tax=Janthinobacterium sp. GMG2 TaxID=3096606 RepID=UPI0029F5AF16|nr:hypothetical protein [Janthinobacterium sp. GMG2]MDX8124930.1 hypothetical protein [Janthinobacterium sp. GMG2]